MTQRTPLIGVLGLALACALACGAPSEEAAPVSDATSTTPSTAEPSAAKAEARPLYYDRAITQADLDDRTLRELSLLRNTIFARVGHTFVKPWLDTYFRSQDWYAPKAKADLNALSQVDRDNVQRIADQEQSWTRGQLLASKTQLLSKKAASQMEPADEIELHLVGQALGEWLGDEKIAKTKRNPLEDPSALDEQLTATQIDKLSRRDLRLLRNTIFARHGRAFESEVLIWYFGTKSWYEVNPAYDDSMITAVDKRNISLIQSQEERMGGALSEWEHMAEEGWFAGA